MATLSTALSRDCVRLGAECNGIAAFSGDDGPASIFRSGRSSMGWQPPPRRQ